MPFTSSLSRCLQSPWACVAGLLANAAALYAVLLRLLGTGVIGPLSSALLLCVLLATVGMTRALLAQHRARRRGAQLVTALSILGTVIVSLWSIVVALGAAFLGALPDGFGRDIDIPPGMVLREPAPSLEPVALDEPAYRPLLRLADAAPPPARWSEVRFDAQAWAALTQRDTELLLRYLRSHPGWRLQAGGGGEMEARRSLDFARRRSHWFDIEVVVLLRSGLATESHPAPAAGVSGGEPAAGLPGHLPLAFESEGQGGLHHARLLIDMPRLRISLRQSSRWPDGQPLQHALDGVAAELGHVLAAGRWHSGLLPPGSVASGSPDIRLAGGAGAFEIEVAANPGEAGRVYRKAFEATRNIEVLATARRPIGWSGQGAELFRLRESVLVHAGDPGVYYPARFEAWFVPDSGAAERKLVEVLYRIDGWQK